MATCIWLFWYKFVPPWGIAQIDLDRICFFLKIQNQADTMMPFVDAAA